MLDIQTLITKAENIKAMSLEKQEGYKTTIKEKRHDSMDLWEERAIDNNIGEERGKIDTMIDEAEELIGPFRQYLNELYEIEEILSESAKIWDNRNNGTN